MKKLLGAAIVALAASAANAQFQGSSVVNTNIPDNVLAGLNNAINVPNAFNVTGITVSLQLTGTTTAQTSGHSWIGDLVATITSPSNQTFVLFQRVGSTSTNPTYQGSPFGSSGDWLLNATMRFAGEDAGQYALYTPPVVAPGNFYTAAGASTSPPAGDYRTTALGTGALTNMFAFFNGTAAQGNWTLNISDRGGGDTGRLASWSLQLLPEPASMALLGLGALALIRRRR